MQSESLAVLGQARSRLFTGVSTSLSSDHVDDRLDRLQMILAIAYYLLLCFLQRLSLTFAPFAAPFNPPSCRWARGYAFCLKVCSLKYALCSTACVMIISTMAWDVLGAIGDMVARGWKNFLARPSGTLNFRFILQPMLASIVAIRDGLKDEKAGKPAFLWEVLTSRTHRTGLLHGAWKALRLPILIASTLDAIYQLSIHHWIYPLELIFTVTLLAVVPYVILRGPVNRAARFLTRFLTRKAGAAELGHPLSRSRPKG